MDLFASRTGGPLAPAGTEDAAAHLPLAQQLARGIGRRLAMLGFGTITEFRVGKGRRVDVAGLHRDGRFAIVEIKTSVADFRSDGKWQDYLPFCDDYYFAVPGGFPTEILPEEEGLMVADAYDAEIVRAAQARTMNAARRRSQLVRFGLAASGRLHHLTDPGLSARNPFRAL